VQQPVFWASIGAASTCVILAVVWPAALWVSGGVALVSPPSSPLVRRPVRCASDRSRWTAKRRLQGHPHGLLISSLQTAQPKGEWWSCEGPPAGARRPMRLERRRRRRGPRGGGRRRAASYQAGGKIGSRG